MQNAIVDNISSIYLRHANVLYTRVLVLALNVPCIVCSLQVSFCKSSCTGLVAASWQLAAAA